MKKLTLIIALCLCLSMLAACKNDEVSYSLTVRNGDDHSVTVKLVDVNNKSYLRDPIKLQSGDEYLLAVTAGSTVKVKVIVQDPLYDEEKLFEERFVDNGGDGFVIEVEYNGDAFYSGTSTMGRLSAWGSK